MKNIRLFIGLLLIFSTMFIACVEDDAQYQFTIDDEYPISIHIGMQPEYSLWKDVMTKGGLYASFNVAGDIRYTLLVPDNESLSKMFETKPLAEWTSEECHELVYNHAFPTEILRESMREGSLEDRTLAGRLVSSQLGNDEEGRQVVILNQNVILRGFPFEATNGFVYGVRGVLTNLDKDLVGILAQREDCSIFVKAMETTGIKAQMAKRDTTLWNDDVVRLTWTVFAVSDSIYKLKGIESYEQLQTLYTRNDAANIQNELTNSENGLFKHISQHIIDEEVYVNSLMTFPTNWGAWAGGEGRWYPSVNHYACFGNTKCLQTGEIDGVVIVNPNVDKTEYTEIINDKSNLIASNGCIHYVNGTVDGVEEPFREMVQSVYSDVRLTDSIEDYRAGSTWNYTNRPIKHGWISEWKWHSEPEQIDLFYSKGNGWYGGEDLVSFNLGGVNDGWIEFQTGPIPAGEYKSIESCIDNPSGGIGTFNLYIDDELVGIASKTWPDGGHYGIDLNVGAITLKKGGRHTIRYDFVSGAGNLRIGHCSFFPKD